MKKLNILFIVAMSLLLTACASDNSRILDSSDASQLQKRSYQSRIFDTKDKARVLRASIETLQDLGFIIDRADMTLGSVSATKLGREVVKITVSVRSKGETQVSVRANGQFNLEPIEDPKQYQNFFASLEKSLFLTAHTGE